ncbi:hypothetical protein FCJ61_17855 [Burkholderia metallica]|nr:hypothetical protein [Burkholderia metallica]
MKRVAERDERAFGGRAERRGEVGQGVSRIGCASGKRHVERLWVSRYCKAALRRPHGGPRTARHARPGPPTGAQRGCFRPETAPRLVTDSHPQGEQDDG